MSNALPVNVIDNDLSMKIGMLVAKADAQIAAMDRLQKSLDTMNDRVSMLERDLNAKVADNSKRITILESDTNHKKNNWTLAGTVVAIGLGLVSMAKTFLHWPGV